MWYPKELKYSQTHEWSRMEDSGYAVIGITDYAQDQLGEIISVNLPEINAMIHAGDETCVIESTKAAADIYASLSGEIVEINEELLDAAGLINNDPYGDGWLYKLKFTDMSEYNELLSSQDYQESIESEE